MIKLTQPTEGALLINPSNIIDIQESIGTDKNYTFTEVSLPCFSVVVMERDFDILEKLEKFRFPFIRFTLPDERDIYIAEHYIVDIWAAHGDRQAAIHTPRDCYYVLETFIDIADRLGVSI